MVSQKRSGYGFSGYQVPWVPRASRSPRVRGSCKKKLEDDRIFAFEVLASLAGKLLQERETPASISDHSTKNQHTIVKSSVKCETRDQEHKIKLEPGDCEEMRANVSHSPGHHQRYILNGFSLKTSSMVKAELPESVCFSDKLAVDCMQNACGSSPSKVAGGFPCSGIFSEGNVHSEIETKPAVGLPVTQTHHKKGSSKEMDRAILAPVHLDNNAKASWLSDHITSGPSPRCQEKLLVSRYDDENSSGWSQPSTITKTYTPTPDIGDQRLGRSSASSCLRGTPSLKEGGSSDTDGRRKPVYCTWKTCQPRQRSQRISPFKRRKSLEQNTESSSDRGSMYNWHKKGKRSEDSSACAAASQAGGASSSVSGLQAPSHSRDCSVKLSIKSFRVPELFVEIPATATVGSLKRAVMEAVTAVLGDGLHVGILLQGKKVGDDNKTLLQTGISQGDKLRTLGFMLEPRQAQPASLCPEDPSVFLHGSTTQRLTSFSATSTTDPRASKIFLDPPVTNLSKGVQKNHDTVPLHAEVSTDKTKRESRALIAVPAASLEPLAMVPFHQKSRRPEFVKRRIRRPFSVSEVEALVQAIENLGTGRWRDVKLCAFDGAKHRTYVDLKDKWKTLVHTAKISPQQRRGEPVPQELLDRVLAAHAYWSQHQVKQQQVKL